jgi:histone H3/H4
MANTNIVIESRVKDFIREKGGEDFRTASGVVEKAQTALENILTDAVNRAKENGRKTVQPQDI